MTGALLTAEGMKAIFLLYQEQMQESGLKK
jgi:hypothetical protein